ncbi:SPOR domain-containing protein [Tenacibaculum sp. UWU-22]|uniref:SPOR domain-containing protein n=1 Tax=Tenacibaculum sp. UWU-22 TaxID=3234187 RepID=UPI0034DAE4A6
MHKRYIIKRYYLFFIVAFLVSCGKKEGKKTLEELTSPLTKDTTVVNNSINNDKAKNMPELIFTVQIAALKNANKKLAEISDIQLYNEGGLTKYRLGKFATYKEAKTYRKTLLKTYSDAFVQAVKDGNAISIKEALK